jgi:hypothetical protein
MIKHVLLSIVVLCGGVFMFGLSNAHAFGFGAYLEATRGSGSYEDFDDDGYSGPNRYNDSIDVDTVGYGFVMDTNLSDPKPFHYRMSLGYSKIDVPESVANDVDGYKISWDHTFGFGVVANENMRFWLGPQIHFDYSNWDIPIGRTLRSKYSVDFFGVGVGLATGVNAHIPNAGSICPEIGVRYQWNVSDKNEETRFYGNSSYYNEADYSYAETVIYLKLSFMFGE